VKKLESNTFWAALQMDDSLKKQVNTAKQQVDKKMQPLMESISHLKSASLVVTLADQLKLTAAATCDDEAPAKPFTGALQGQWEQYKIGIGMLALGLPGDISKVVNELTNSVKFETNGAVSQVSCQIAMTTLTKAIEAGKKFDWSKLQKRGAQRGR